MPSSGSESWLANTQLQPNLAQIGQNNQPAGKKKYLLDIIILVFSAGCFVFSFLSIWARFGCECVFATQDSDPEDGVTAEILYRFLRT